MKHFNRAIVWGQIEDITAKTTENKKSYLELKVNCKHGKFGNVLAFGRLRGKEAVASFEFKKWSLVKLTGSLAQYEGRNKEIKTNFNFYKAEPWDPANDQHSHRRATFILAGLVTGFAEGKDEGALMLLVSIENEGREPDEHSYQITVPSSIALDFLTEYPAGTTIRVKGQIEQKEDEYGDVIKYARPVAAQISRGKEEAPF